MFIYEHWWQSEMDRIMSDPHRTELFGSNAQPMHPVCCHCTLQSAMFVIQLAGLIVIIEWFLYFWWYVLKIYLSFVLCIVYRHICILVTQLDLVTQPCDGDKSKLSSVNMTNFPFLDLRHQYFIQPECETEVFEGTYLLCTIKNL